MNKNVTIMIPENTDRKVFGGKTKIYFSLLGVFVAVFLFTFLTQRFKNNDTAEAANLGGFDAGYIISDWQMGNYNSMSEADIQNFLTRMNPCGNRDYGLYVDQTNRYGGSGYKWHWEGDHFVCLSQERFNGVEVGSGETAAHIIWQTAQDYRINPQVLIVLLEKENGLITDTFPHNNQYRTATGFGCPDTAACDSQYFGFKNQLRQAAALFRTVLDGGWSNYPVGNNYVQYHPNGACGGSVINIRNRATSALYRYTPYQPNWAALNWTSDGCSSYGNRNFYSYFEDWFGGIRNEVEPYEEAKTNYEHTISDGVYRLVSKESNKIADIYGGVSANAKMQVFDKKTSNYNNQIFEVKYDNSNGYYSIINPSTGSAFDVRSVGTNNRTPIDIFPSNSGCNQDWLFKKDGQGYYTIVSRCSSRVIDVKQGTNDLIIFDNHNGDNQKWKLEKVIPDENLNGTYRFVSKMYPNEVIDIEGGLKTNASLISFEKKMTSFDNQKFQIKYDETDGFYNIINPINGSAFDVRDGRNNKSNLTPVDVFPFHSNCNQDWTLEKDNEGYYKFRSACSGRVLDIVAGTRKLIIFDDHNGDNQKWRLERTN